jgi:glycosyltransferase involved in cell wall biosynthesis
MRTGTFRHQLTTPTFHAMIVENVQRERERSGAAVSVVIPTRARPATLRATVESLLACDPCPSEIIVVDQSPDTTSRDALSPYLDDIVYLPTASVGVSVARNLGIRAARHDIIALTDDDCVVPPDWPLRITTVVREHPTVGVFFGNVVAMPHDPALGFVPAYEITEPFIARSVADKTRVEGLSANMAFPRSTWHALHGFDELLGVGGMLRSSAETDFTLRALQQGMAVMDEPSITLRHDGFRAWDDGVRLIGRYLYGNGALMAKHVRCRPASAVTLLARMLQRWLFGKPAVAMGTPLRRWLRLRAFAEGFVAGWQQPVDRATCLYRPQRA